MKHLKPKKHFKPDFRRRQSGTRRSGRRPPDGKRVRPLPAERSATPRRRSGIVALFGMLIVGILVLSYTAIALLGVALYKAGITQIRVPDIVRVCEAIVAATLIVALLLVNWRRYWKTHLSDWCTRFML